ncbi:hypothetical protein [Nitrosomonas sp. Is37]|uniref:hypothetical protein n=1 Tax=Nitrosomonas sp. Is37 TaxID=3080535 RepID=UPI00294B364A|nr:hypothetical protein [Nitrosomonas sp. Is37]MDV6343270.1 hypothetical protein [Nitrosomonas sp. Is37]
MTQNFHLIFKRADSSVDRAKFLSRIFGIFSEEIVSLWAQDERAPYRNLGRPTIKTPGDSRGHTLDFTFQERSSGNIFVVEMKCEIEYQNFRYFILEQAKQLEHHNKPAFEAFLRTTKFPSDQAIFVGGKAIKTHGAILIWGSVTPEGRKAVIASKGFYDVLSIEEICHELSGWNHGGYKALLAERQGWCNELFAGLSGGHIKNTH